MIVITISVKHNIKAINEALSMVNTSNTGPSIENHITSLPVVNLKDFTEGGTNSSVKIQAAIDKLNELSEGYGGSLIIPSGNYTLSEKINIPSTFKKLSVIAEVINKNDSRLFKNGYIFKERNQTNIDTIVNNLTSQSYSVNLICNNLDTLFNITGLNIELNLSGLRILNRKVDGNFFLHKTTTPLTYRLNIDSCVIFNLSGIYILGESSSIRNSNIYFYPVTDTNTDIIEIFGSRSIIEDNVLVSMGMNNVKLSIGCVTQADDNPILTENGTNIITFRNNVVLANEGVNTAKTLMLELQNTLATNNTIYVTDTVFSQMFKNSTFNNNFVNCTIKDPLKSGYDQSDENDDPSMHPAKMLINLTNSMSNDNEINWDPNVLTTEFKLTGSHSSFNRNSFLFPEGMTRPTGWIEYDNYKYSNLIHSGIQKDIYKYPQINSTAVGSVICPVTF